MRARTFATAPDCTAIKLVGVRGSGDTSSKLGVIATALSRALGKRARAAGLSYQGFGIPYTAVGISWEKLLDDLQLPEYRLSVRDGRNKLSGFIHEQAQDCPSEKLAVVGYSQGAQVVGDVFSKGLGRLTVKDLGLVKAVALAADPRFNSRESYDRGSFRRGRNGLLGARSPGDLGSISSHLRAWCRKDDLICQGPGTTGNHAQTKYLADYKDAIVGFLASALDVGLARDSAAIHAAALAAWVKAGCDDPANWLGGKVQPFQFRGAMVSKADARYGESLNAGNECMFNLGFVFRRPSADSEQWSVVLPLADSAQLCSSYRKLIPEKVLRDFGIEGQTSSSGGFGPC
jgi:Cutinase